MPKAAKTDWRVEMCSTCHYCKADHCHRFPPNKSKWEYHTGEVTQYPKVNGSEACGEYKL